MFRDEWKQCFPKTKQNKNVFTCVGTSDFIFFLCFWMSENNIIIIFFLNV